MTKENLAQDYLRTLVIALCREPEKVEIKTHLDEGGRGIVLNVLASDTDLPLLIGKKGITARSIRRIMSAWCEINDARLIIHVGNPIHEHTDD